jgi:polyferredoxin
MPRIVENGAIDNVYRLQVMNTEEHPHRYTIEVTGIPGVKIVSENFFDMAAATTKAIPVRVRVPEGQAKPGSNRLTFIVHDQDYSDVSVSENAVFLVPR